MARCAIRIRVAIREIESAYDSAYGARPLKRAVQRFIEDPVSELIITERMFGSKRENGRLRVCLDKADSRKLKVHFVDHLEQRTV